MPFCPKCRDEFQDWAKTCPDCRVDLVAELPPEPAKAKDEPVLVASASNEPEARMWAGILEDNRIPSMVRSYSSEMFQGFPPTTSPVQPSNLQFDVYVLQPDLERARDILGRISGTDSAADRPQGAAASPKPNAPLVRVATPSNAAEAAMLAEMLEENGIRCTTRGLHGKPVRSSPREIHVLDSDATRAREILGRIYNSAGRAELSEGLPAKKRRWITSAVGMIDIFVFGIAGLSLAVAFGTSGALSDIQGDSRIYAQALPILLAVTGILAIPGGVCTLQRKNWWIALAGNVAVALGFFPLGLLFLGPIVMYRDEFE
jgi:hypothetical protein